MYQIEINSWNEGMEKVSLTKLQIDLLNIPLAKAKKNVDSVLEGEIVHIDVYNYNTAHNFVEQATKLGVNCSLIKMEG